MRLIPRSFSTLLFVVAIGLFAAMWYYTNQLNQGAFKPDNTPPPLNVRVIEVVDGSRIALSPLDGADSEMWRQDGFYGLEWPGGYARVGRIIDVHPDRVVREFILLDAEPDGGMEARLDTFVYRGNPEQALGILFDDIIIETPAGSGPAWLIPGSSETWAIFIHGKGSNREEAFRVLPTLTGLSLPTMLITYRNDPEFSAIDEGRYGYGESEWQDVTAAMDYALTHGAERFVLLGNSMGGAIAMAVLQQPEYAPRVAAVILDSPMLNLKRTVEFRAAQRNLPGIFTSAALQFATWRNGVDWTKTDYLSDAAALTTPVLLFHGDADRVVPTATSDEFAQARPDLVTFRRLAGVDHVQGWNADRESYTVQVREFLRRTLGQ